MIKGFEFAAEGRTYVCSTEERRGTSGEFWWWFSVTGDTSEYAPFQAMESDTRGSVQERVVAFYTHRLYVRSQPSQHGSHWGRRAPAAETATAGKTPKAAFKKKAKGADDSPSAAS